MTTDRRAAARLAAPTINLASIVHGLDAYMRARGADAGEALRRAGLEPGDLTDPERRVPLLRYLELLEICAELLADRQFGLKFGAQYEPRHAGVVGNVALAARTVGEAFAMIGRYLPTMVDATVHGIDVSDGTAFVYSYYIDPLMMSYRQKGDWAIAFACNLVRVGLGDPRWTPQEVLLPQLADETPAERRVRAEIMGDKIRVGHPWAGIRFDAALLARPMATADAAIENLMRHYGDLRLAALPDGRSEIEQLRREIARALVKGESTIEALARATGTSVRTLQRRLKDAGVTYADLQNDVRRTLALNLLENDTLALAEIAFSLGYSEVSAFNHAFRRWVGQSPGEYRRVRGRAARGNGAAAKVPEPSERDAM
jgi:AraC-like DNA-binding protein